MKKLPNMYFRKLSLTQQVLLIILIMLILLSLFFTLILSTNIDETITKQMFQMMANKQEPLSEALDDEVSISTDSNLLRYLASDAEQTTLLVENDTVYFLSSQTENNPDNALISTLVNEADAFEQTNDQYLESTVDVGSHLFYYRMEKVHPNGASAVLVSYMSDVYAKSFRTSLVDSTVYVTVLMFSIILMILLLWVFSIIRPLNQIKAFIAQIKQGKDVTLNLNRQDEIGELAHELNLMKDELRKQEKAKEEMIHNISHDLKTPIATIKSYSESIKDGIYPYGTLERSVDVILDNAQRLEDKVHNLLYLNRVEYLVTSDSDGVVTNMKECIEEVVLNTKVIRPEIQIITDVEEVFFDGLLESWRVTIENIIENAFRYAKSYIKIEVHEDDLRISNDGPKMDENRIDSLFKPYVMGEGGRFGLGLSIVSKVTKANRYKVQGYNTSDGVCFRIYRDQEKKTEKIPRLRKKNG
jgi:two-component system sensor histidine kinase CssS